MPSSSPTTQPHTGIPNFYISFVLSPLISNGGAFVRRGEKTVDERRIDWPACPVLGERFPSGTRSRRQITASVPAEALAAYAYSQKKTSKTITIALATLLGASIMNATFVLSVFLLLIYARGT